MSSKSRKIASKKSFLKTHKCDHQSRFCINIPVQESQTPKRAGPQYQKQIHQRILFSKQKFLLLFNISTSLSSRTRFNKRDTAWRVSSYYKVAKIILTDESKFSREGILSRSVYYRADEIPYAFSNKFWFQRFR